MNKRVIFKVSLLLIMLFLPSWLNAEELTLFSLKDTADGQDYSVKLQILLLMTVLSLLPALLMVLTSFTRIIIVLAILRQAMGLQQSPPNKILIGISLMLTMLIMRPVWQDIYQNAYTPFQQQTIGLEEALLTAEKPLRAFMLRQTRESELRQVLLIANEPTTLTAQEIPFEVLMPAFV